MIMHIPNAQKTMNKGATETYSVLVKEGFNTHWASREDTPLCTSLVNNKDTG